MNYKIAVSTDIGTRKSTNQDSCLIKKATTNRGTILMALICDGMGGFAKGELASKTLIQRFGAWFENELPTILGNGNELNGIQVSWNRIVQEQNQIIGEYGIRHNVSLGTTISVIIVLEDGNYLIGHIGDTRIYEIGNSNINLLTEDQTLVEMEVKAGKLTPEQAKVDPRRNVILQCVGASRVVRPAFYTGTIKTGTSYMICCDGFRHVINEEEMVERLKPSANSNEQEMKAHIDELIEINKQRNETDNISALLVIAE